MSSQPNETWACSWGMRAALAIPMTAQARAIALAISALLLAAPAPAADFTDSVEDLAAGLMATLQRGGAGATNFTAALDLATRELGSDVTGVSEVRASATRVVLFITDGAPTLPVGKGTVIDKGDIESAIEAAEKAAALGIRIHTYAVGPGAIAYPTAAVRIAEVSGGQFLPLVTPARLLSHFGSVLNGEVLRLDPLDLPRPQGIR